MNVEVLKRIANNLVFSIFFSFCVPHLCVILFSEGTMTWFVQFVQILTEGILDYINLLP
jgi:hypothetical protein